MGRKRKERPYIQSARIISGKGEKPKARVVVILESGRRQRTQELTRADDLPTFRKLMLKTKWV